MCFLYGEYTEQDNYTGYKIAMKHRQTGKYYSPAIGIEYVEKAFVEIPEIQKRLVDSFSEGILKFIYNGFNEDFEGKTAVFCKLKNAIDFVGSMRSINMLYKTCILKMTISNKLMEGEYNFSRIIAGDYIESMVEIVGGLE